MFSDESSLKFKNVELYPFIALSQRFGPSKTRGVRKQRGFQKRLSRLWFEIAQTVHKYLLNNTKLKLVRIRPLFLFSQTFVSIC